MNTDQPFDLDQQQAFRQETERQKKLEQEIAAEDWKWLMSSKQGRRTVWRILQQAGVFRLSYAASSHDTAFNEGQRNVGLFMLAPINAHCPEMYLLMIKESHGTRHPDDGSA